MIDLSNALFLSRESVLSPRPLFSGVDSAFLLIFLWGEGMWHDTEGLPG